VGFLDNLIVTVDGKVLLHETFDSLDEWSQHQDAEIQPAFALVSKKWPDEEDN